VQEEILAKHPSAVFRVYAVWFNMVEGDKRASWPSGLFSDSRVAEFWDEEKVLGRWFGHHPDYLNEEGVLWDTYLLYGPESRWSDRPSDNVSWGYTIMRTRERMRRDLVGLLGK